MPSRANRTPSKCHRRTHATGDVLSCGAAKKMMIGCSGLNEEVQLRPNDLQDVLRKAASEGCESTLEEVRGHTKQFEEQSSAPCSSSLGADNPITRSKSREEIRGAS